ncbi:hypothetical protein MRX96_058963 [Rhipicephalus microplus]
MCTYAGLDRVTQFLHFRIGRAYGGSLDPARRTRGTRRAEPPSRRPAFPISLVIPGEKGSLRALSLPVAGVKRGSGETCSAVAPYMSRSLASPATCT